MPRDRARSAAHRPTTVYVTNRYKADQAFQVGAGKSPVGAYLDIDSIIQVAKRNGAYRTLIDDC